MQFRRLAAAMFFSVAPPVFAEEIPRSVSVIGEAQAQIKPDIATLVLSIAVEKPTAADAEAEIARISKSVIDGLQSFGVAPQDVQTEGLTVNPEIESSYISQKRSISGYRAETTLAVQVRKIESAGALTGAAVENGALYQYIQFDVSDRSQREDALRAAAVENARHRAELYAKGAGMKLGLPRAIVAEGSSAHDVVMYPHKSGAKLFRSGPEGKSSVERGLMTLQETVDVTFELSPP